MAKRRNFAQNEHCLWRSVTFAINHLVLGSRVQTWTKKCKRRRTWGTTIGVDISWNGKINQEKSANIHRKSKWIDVSRESVGTLFQNAGYRKVCSRFVPRFLTPNMQANRMLASQQNFEVVQQYGERFLHNILTRSISRSKKQFRGKIFLFQPWIGAMRVRILERHQKRGSARSVQWLKNDGINVGSVRATGLKNKFLKVTFSGYFLPFFQINTKNWD